MGNDLITRVTLATDFVGMAASLWLAFYVLPRGRANRLTFRLIVALLSLSFYYFIRLTVASGPNPISTNLLTFSVVITLTAVHNLSHYLLPGPLQAKYLLLPRGILLLSLVAAIIALTVPTNGNDLRLVNYPSFATPFAYVGVFDFLAASAILWNFWLIVRQGALPVNRSFLYALLFAIGTIAYSFIGVVFGLDIPQFVGSLMVLAGLILIGYSVARHQALIERRILSLDLPVSALIGLLLFGIYLLTAFSLGLSVPGAAVLLALIITTHGGYGWTREHFLRRLSRHERDIAEEIRQMGRGMKDGDDLDQALRRSLAIVCHTLHATGGLTAVRQEGIFVVRSSLHTLSVGEHLPEWEGAGDEISAPVGPLREQINWLVPGFSGGEKLVLLGVAERRRLRAYTNADLEWLQDVTDQLAQLVFTHVQRTQPEGEPEDIANDLATTLTHKPNGDLLKAVEDGFRNLHDFILLGKSPLAVWLNAAGGTHIERGRRVQQKLIDTLQSLRPEGERPEEPLPRAWHSYVILHDAYVEDVPDREIMARLYVSEGTYYRTRRKAIRGVTRAIMETEFA